MIVVIIVKNDNHNNNNDKDYWVLKRYLLIKLLGTTDTGDIKRLLLTNYIYIKKHNTNPFVLSV